MVTDGYWWLLLNIYQIHLKSVVFDPPPYYFNDGDKPISNPTTSEKLTRKKWSQCSYKGSIDLTLGWSKSGRRAGSWRFKAIKQKKTGRWVQTSQNMRLSIGIVIPKMLGWKDHK